MEKANPEMTADDVIEFVKLLNDNSIDVCVDGGWGVDALLGKQTRRHNDLDIAVEHKDVPAIRALLEARNYKDVPRDDTRECNFVLGDDEGHEIDIHSYTFDSAGNLIFGIEYPYDSLNGTGSINDLSVKCITPEWMVKFHTWYKPDEDDYHDIKLLCQKFGIELPPEFKEFALREAHDREDKKDKTIPTPYPELNHVLRVLVDSAQEILRENFVGAYLQGSFAVGDFDIHSDVDFIIVTESEPSGEQVPALQVIHERVYNLASPWAQHLEGSYFPREILRHHSQRGKKLWYLDNGSRSLIESDHCNTIVVRWVVREKGITLAGPPPDTLVEPMTVEALRAEIMKVITGWGQEIIDHPDQYNNRFYQTYIVLNFSRMLHDIHTGYPGSKRAGAEWAKINLDPAWHGLIDRTWSGRPNPEISVRQPADPKDFESTLKFVGYIINESKQYEVSNK